MEGSDGTQAKGLQGAKLEAVTQGEARFCASQLVSPGIARLHYLLPFFFKRTHLKKKQL